PNTSDRVESYPMTSTRTSILFVCVRNGGKSQMAAAIANNYAGDRFEIYSAGTAPGTALNADSVAALAEIGVDMSQGHPKGIDWQLLGGIDQLVILGADAHVDLPDCILPTIELWITYEPSARGIEGIDRMRLIRDDLAARVRGLISQHIDDRSEEHTSELQSRFDLVCRLLLEKKKEHN